MEYKVCEVLGTWELLVAYKPPKVVITLVLFRKKELKEICIILSECKVMETLCLYPLSCLKAHNNFVISEFLANVITDYCNALLLANG